MPWMRLITIDSWDDYFARMAQFHMFAWGKEVSATPDYMPIKRSHLDITSLAIYDEYIDLPSGEIDPQVAQQSTEFTDARGGATPVQLVAGDIDNEYGSSIVNKIKLEALGRDWIGPTKHRTKPYPDSDNTPPKVWFVNEVLEAAPSTAINGYMTLAATWLYVGGESYAMPPCVVPYNALTDTIRMEYYHDGGYYIGVQIYVGDVEQSEYPQQFSPWPDWENWRLVDHHRRLDVVTVRPSLWEFTVSGITTDPTVGAVYTTDSPADTELFTVISTNLSGTPPTRSGTILCYATGVEITEGVPQTLTKISGTGDATIAASTSDDQTVTGFNATTGTWLDDTLVARALTNCFCPFIPLNHGISRLGADWHYRNQETGGSEWPKILIMNSDTHKYYKGYLLEVSSVFIEGPTAQSENSWQLTLAVTEEGDFEAEAWDGFNQTALFHEIDRYEQP